MTPRLSSESTTLPAAITADSSFHREAAEEICPARSVDHPGPNTQCQPISSSLAVEGVERDNAGRIRCERARALPSRSRLGQRDVTASSASGSIQLLDETFGSGTSGNGTTLIEPSSASASRRAVKTGS
uniref:Uncharacterized protein n=2 Tax=environmental samples TaxID=68359 RepID=A0A075FWX2_9EURY|nr:hypothetical protein [uncultured marine group II/III euryarchaeote AD1000_70_A02]AIF00769.1 hypothetical protein [uncultured marine group II/III euryarchaeote KM3_138_E07]